MSISRTSLISSFLILVILIDMTVLHKWKMGFLNMLNGIMDLKLGFYRLILSRTQSLTNGTTMQSLSQLIKRLQRVGWSEGSKIIS